MKKTLFAALAALLVTLAPARADYAPPAFGIDRTTPSASPVCIMSGATCKVQLGTANLSTGAFAISAGSLPTPTLGVTRSQIATTTISTAYQSFTTAGDVTVFDGGEGCKWTRATVSAPGAVQSAIGPSLDIAYDTTTTPGAMIVKLKRNQSFGGTGVDGTASIAVKGKIRKYVAQ